MNMVSTLLLAYHSRLYASLPFAPGLEEETMSAPGEADH